MELNTDNNSLFALASVYKPSMKKSPNSPSLFILYSWHAARQIYTSDPQGLGQIR